MTISLDDLDRLIKEHDDETKEERLCALGDVAFAYLFTLTGWIARARTYLEKELPHLEESLERFSFGALENNKVAQTVVKPRILKDIALLKQLLAEVEE